MPDSLVIAFATGLKKLSNSIFKSSEYMVKVVLEPSLLVNKLTDSFESLLHATITKHSKTHIVL